MGNSKLMLGLGLGAIIGGVVTYLAGTRKGRKLRSDVCCALHEIGDDAEELVYAAKDKAEQIGHKVASKVANKTEAAKEKFNEITNPAK